MIKRMRRSEAIEIVAVIVYWVGVVLVIGGAFADHVALVIAGGIAMLNAYFEGSLVERDLGPTFTHKVD